uniref:Testis expressed 36 n=1 Tax=Apteryx owenii TaxID=8824 RepID=A0A8B9QWH3_APTOW
MPKGRSANPCTERDGAWFAHMGLCQSHPESTTGSALKQVQNAEEVEYIEERLPPGYRAREQKAVNNNFPFSSHDNRHCLQNVGEYFDFSSKHSALRTLTVFRIWKVLESGLKIMFSTSRSFPLI